MKKENIFLLVTLLSLPAFYNFLYGVNSIFPNESVWFGIIRHAHGGVFAAAGYMLWVTIIQSLNAFSGAEIFKKVFTLEMKIFIVWMVVVGVVWELFELYLFIFRASLFGRMQDVNPFVGIDFPIDIMADLLGALIVLYVYGFVKKSKSKTYQKAEV